ncbi:MAG: MFS transporter [Deltaproteobacteria bacterium]|nr:MFS transporter [Deltaproteobacteria bacterium]
MSALVDFFRTGPDRPPLEDSAAVDRVYRRTRVLVLVAVTVGYGISYTCRLGYAAAKKPLIDAGLFNANELGQIGQAFFYTYALGKFLNGFFGDHANVRRLFSMGVLCSALVNLAMGSHSGFWFWTALWGLNGWFQSTGAPTGAVVLANWFSNRERGRYYGVFSASHSIGEGLSFLLLGVLISAWGWRLGFWGPAALGAVTALGIYLMLRDRPPTIGLPPVAIWKNDFVDAGASEKKSGPTWRAQLEVLKNPSIWIIGLANGCMYVTRYAINSWGWLYLQDAKGYSQIEAGVLLAINTVAGMCGAFSFGLISDKLFKARRPPCNLIFGLVEVGALCLLFFGPSGNGALFTAALLVYGFALNGLLASLGGLFAIDLSPKRAAGAAMGVVGLFAYLGAGIQERVSGYLIQRGTTMVEGVRQVDYSAPVAFWLGASVLSMLLAASLWRAKMRD